MANLLYINQFPDRKADIQAHKLHWVARLSPHVARWGYVMIALLAWLTLLALIVTGVLPVLASISALPAVLSIKAARILLQHAETPQKLAPAIQMTILAMLAHGALLTLALVIASFVAV
jgi:1,4-dihydroxy-2-naphthoate octaprenyltransferase